MQKLIEKRNQLSYSDFDTWLLSNLDDIIEEETQIILDTYKRGVIKAPLDFDWACIVDKKNT